MALFDQITDKKELDELLFHLRASARDLSAAHKTAKDIITRKMRVPEFVRTTQRKLFPQFTQMVLEARELIAEAKEQRQNVEGNARDDDNS